MGRQIPMCAFVGPFESSSVAVAVGLANNPNAEWTEFELPCFIEVLCEIPDGGIEPDLPATKLSMDVKARLRMATTDSV